jgi:hypothetical protein
VVSDSFYQRTRAAQGRPVSDGWCAHTYKQNFSMASGLHHTPQQITPEVTNFIKSKQIAFAKRKEKEGEAA